MKAVLEQVQELVRLEPELVRLELELELVHLPK
jgi:hypothetical protein